MDKLEKEIEARLKAELEKLGCLVLKFVSPGAAGVPDRIVLVPGAMAFFVETKRPSDPPRPLQVSWMKRLEHLGFPCMVVSTERHVRECVRLAQRAIALRGVFGR